MGKKRILFVDDEPNILSGLKRMLRSMRKECDMAFAESGAEGIEILEKDSFEVVVSDMRMPGMDGAHFLSQVQERFPGTIRIMLSGQADDESILRTVGVVHQFLSKPCEPDRLKEVIVKALALHDLLENDELKSLISSINSLPSIPEVYSQLQDAMKNPEVSVDDVAKIIEQDMAMSTKVLHLVNSAFFGLYSRIESPSRAVKLLGLDTVKALVLGVELFSQTNIDKNLFSQEELWNHSMTVGKLAKTIATEESEDQEFIGDAFLAGILHDIGRLVLATSLPEKYLQVITTASENAIPLYKAEIEELSAAHSDVGAYLIGLWGFTSPIMEAIGFHHNLSHYPAQILTPAHVVHAADVFYYQLQGISGKGEPPQLDLEQLEPFADEGRRARWEEICRKVIEGEGV